MIILLTVMSSVSGKEIGNLEEEGALTDARVTTDKHAGSRHEAAAEHPTELGAEAPGDRHPPRVAVPLETVTTRFGEGDRRGDAGGIVGAEPGPVGRGCRGGGGRRRGGRGRRAAARLDNGRRGRRGAHTGPASTATARGGGVAEDSGLEGAPGLAAVTLTLALGVRAPALGALVDGFRLLGRRGGAQGRYETSSGTRW